MRILIIEDDRDAAQYLAKGLRESGHSAEVVRDGREGLLQAATGAWDVLIVDRMLPGLDGLSLVRHLVPVEAGAGAELKDQLTVPPCNRFRGQKHCMEGNLSPLHLIPDERPRPDYRLEVQLPGRSRVRRGRGALAGS